MAGPLGWLQAIEKWGSQSARHGWLLVLGVVGIFVAILLLGAVLAFIYLLPPHSLDLW